MVHMTTLFLPMTNPTAANLKETNLKATCPSLTQRASLACSGASYSVAASIGGNDDGNERARRDWG